MTLDTFLIGSKVVLTRKACVVRQEEMWRRVGVIVDAPIPNDNWRSVQWDGNEVPWMEHVDNLMKV